MKIQKTLSTWWREAFRKRRLSLRNATDGAEEWHIHLSPAGVFAAFVSSVLLLFIVLLLLVAYTPVLEFLPGYRTEATRMRESLVRDVMRLDSMERRMNDMMLYNENIALIMEGKTPVVRTPIPSDSARLDKTLVPPSHEDSLLRQRIEQARNEGQPVDRVVGGMVTPVEGIVTGRFNIEEGHLGVQVAVQTGAGVTAVAGGTVVLSLWSPDTGYVVQIQHPDNRLSIYRNLAQSLVTPGQTVRGGEAIGYAVSPDAPAEDNRVVEFELWNDGKPVDPERYIPF